MWYILSLAMFCFPSLYFFLEPTCPLLLMLVSHHVLFSSHINIFASQSLYTFHYLSPLVSVLNQLPLPSPLPATTTKSLLYNGRIAEEVTCLLGCRDENLASQLAHGLNQVSTEHMWVYTWEYDSVVPYKESGPNLSWAMTSCQC